MISSFLNYCCPFYRSGHLSSFPTQPVDQNIWIRTKHQFGLVVFVFWSVGFFLLLFLFSLFFFCLLGVFCLFV